MLNLMRLAWRNRVQTFLVTRSQIRYGASGTSFNKPAHQLPEVTKVEYLTYGTRSNSPRWTTDPSKALQYGLLRANLVAWLLRDNVNQLYHWSVTGYADALLVHAMRDNGETDEPTIARP